jgi:hypothetical protein
VIKFSYGWLPFEQVGKNGKKTPWCLIILKKINVISQKWTYILYNKNNIVKDLMKTFLNSHWIELHLQRL